MAYLHCVIMFVLCLEIYVYKMYEGGDNAYL
jgi:hypothetical protein